MLNSEGRFPEHPFHPLCNSKGVKLAPPGSEGMDKEDIYLICSDVSCSIALSGSLSHVLQTLLGMEFSLGALGSLRPTGITNLLYAMCIHKTDLSLTSVPEEMHYYSDYYRGENILHSLPKAPPLANSFAGLKVELSSLSQVVHKTQGLANSPADAACPHQPWPYVQVPQSTKADQLCSVLCYHQHFLLTKLLLYPAD